MTSLKFTPSIHPFSSKTPTLGEMVMQLSQKYHLSPTDHECLENFTNSLTIITKENFYHELLSNIDITMWWNKSTALMIAVQEGNLEVVKILLKMGSSIDLKNSIGNTALMIAAEHGELNILELLFQNNADLNCSNEYGQTALMLAIEGNQVDVVRYILETDSKQLDIRNKYNKNPLIIACEFGKYDIAKMIIDLMKKFKNYDDAAFVRSLNRIHTLEDKEQEHQDSTVELPPKKMGNTPLMFACRGDTDDHEKIALMLLDLQGINLNSMNQYGDSALAWAALAGRNVVIQRIIDHPDFKVPTTQDMSKVLENLCSFDFADLTQTESTVDHLSKYITAIPQSVKQLRTIASSRNNNNHHHQATYPPSSFPSHYQYHHPFVKQAPSFHNMSTREVNHEESLKAVLEYMNKKYTPEEIYKMKYQGEKDQSILKTGLIHGNIRVITLHFLRKDDESDLLSCDIGHLLTTSQQKEMLRRLSLRKDSLQLLVRLAALYHIHFEILKLYLKYIENSVGLLDTELPIFYRCLHYGCLDNLTSGKYDDGGVYIQEDLEAFELPLSFLNFPKHLTHVNVVEKLVELSLLFSTEASQRPMERIDLLTHLKVVDNMLLECFKAESFASKETMQKFIDNHLNENSFVRLAHAFMRGPLARCIRQKTSIVFNSGHINSYVNKLYWGYMRDNSQNHILKIRLKNKCLLKIRQLLLYCLQIKKIPKRLDNLIECKSNLIFLRFNPSCMYFLEGLAKGMLLSLLVYKVAYNYHHQSVNIAIVVMIISMVLYEYGEMCDNKFISIPTMRSVKNYFTSIWNILDDISYLLVILGIYADNWGVLSLGRGYFSVAVIFNSISMLNYFGAYEPIGQLLIMVFAMSSDLMKFVFIFIFCIFGFCVAMYSLQKNQSSDMFRTRMRTFLSLFDAAFLNYPNFDEVFLDHNEYYLLSIIIEMVYIVFTAVVLLNLIIARMSATHDQIHKKSFEEWQYTRAFTVYSFLLLNERSPFSMLPPPFNLIPTFFSIFDYFHLWWHGLEEIQQPGSGSGSGPLQSEVMKPSKRSTPPSLESSQQQSQQQQQQQQSQSLQNQQSPQNQPQSQSQLQQSQPQQSQSQQSTTLLSISGTASDWLMGFLISFICPILELLFYLISTLYNHDLKSYLGDIIFILGFFPLLYPFYVLSLIIQTFSIVTRIDLRGEKLSKKQLPICYYETQFADIKSENESSSSTSPSPFPSPSPATSPAIFTTEIPTSPHHPSSSTSLYPTTSPSTSINSDIPTIDVKVIRVKDMIDILHTNHLPIVQIQIQNVVNYCGNCIREGTTKNYVYAKPLLRYPLKQLQLDTESIEMGIFVLDKDILTGRNEVVASVVVPSDQVREWIANGRFEGTIDFTHGRGAIQVVISTCIFKGKRTMHLHRQETSAAISQQQQQQQQRAASQSSLRKRTQSIQQFFLKSGGDTSDSQNISRLFMISKPEVRTKLRRHKLLFDEIEIEKIFPPLQIHEAKDRVFNERSRAPSMVG